MKTKNIIIILSQYYPAVTPNVLRWEKISTELIKQGHSVTIFTTKSNSTQNDYYNAEGIRIIRAGHNTLMDYWQYLNNSKNKRNEYNASTKKSGFIKKLVESVINITWRKLYWPDGTCVWYFPAKNKLRSVLNDSNYDVVISVGLPFTAHLVARSLKKLSPSTKWIMDIEDPFCYSDIFWVNNFSLYAQLNKKIEGICLSEAHKISVTNENALKMYLELFPKINHKISVIPPLLGYSTTNANQVKTLEAGCIHLGYFGSFYSNVREPEVLITFLNNVLNYFPELMEKMRIHIVGQLNPAHVLYFENINQSLNKNIIRYGFLEYRATQSLMSQMDALINVGNTTTYHLPSKIVDYLGANKPIVNLISNDDDSVKSLLSNNTLFLHLGPTFSQSDILKFNDYIQKHLNIEFNHSLSLEKFKPLFITNQYLDMMNS